MANSQQQFLKNAQNLIERSIILENGEQGEMFTWPGKELVEKIKRNFASTISENCELPGGLTQFLLTSIRKMEGAMRVYKYWGQ